MATERHREVVRRDAVAVIDDANEVRAALLHVDLNARRPGVHGVLEQLLDDAGGPFDDLACGNLVDDERRQLLDAWHACPCVGHRPVFGSIVGGASRCSAIARASSGCAARNAVRRRSERAAVRRSNSSLFTLSFVALL